MEQAKIVYQDRILKITKRLSKEGVKYTIKMTDGLISRSREECFNNDAEAIESARINFGNLYRKEVT